MREISSCIEKMGALACNTTDNQAIILLMGMTPREEFIKENKGYIAPRIVADRSKLTKIEDAVSGVAKIYGKIGTLNVLASKKKPHLVIYETLLTDSSGSIRTIWFNMPSIEYVDKKKSYIFLGKVEESGGNKTFVNPIFTTPTEVKKWQKIYEGLER